MKRLLLAVLLLCSCRTTGAPVGDAAVTARARALVDRFLDETLAATPDLARAAGLHAYDGRVPHLGPERVTDERARAQAYLAETAALPLDELPDPERLDVQLTRLEAERTLFRLDTLKLPERVMSYLDLFDVTSYLVRDYAPLPQRIAKLLDHVEAATAEVDVVLAMLRPVQVRTHLETARSALAGLREYYEGDVAKAARPALDADPALAARYAVVVPAALAAVDRYVAWIDAHLPQADEDFAIGGEALLRMIEVNEGVRYTLPELQAMAEADFRKNHQAYVETARRIDPNKTVAEVAAMVAAERLPDGDAVMAAARRQLTETRAFVEAHGLMTLSPDGRVEVAVTPPFMRWNSAFLDSAGPFEEAPGSYYYITPPDPSWPKEVQEGYLFYEGDLLATTIHEVYPGHFVQGQQVRRAASRAQKLMDSYAFAEGWAHYVEQLMFDVGYGQGDARLQLGQLANALLRNCRFLAALGMHTGKMTVAQADELFRTQCFVDPGNAKQQAYRGTFDPGYLSYTLGKLQILELRAKWQAKHGDAPLGRFHDWLLSYGSSPVALIGQRL